MIGKTLGHYQITEKLGTSGIGVIREAHDTYLDRYVALELPTAPSGSIIRHASSRAFAKRVAAET